MPTIIFSVYLKSFIIFKRLAHPSVSQKAVRLLCQCSEGKSTQSILRIIPAVAPGWVYFTSPISVPSLPSSSSESKVR